MDLSEKNGFSTGELLVSLFVVIILATIVLSALSLFRKKSDLNRTAEHTALLLSEARTKSLSSENASQYGVHIEPDKIVVFKGPAYNSADPENRITATPPTVTISWALNGAGQDILFKRLIGETDQYGTITIQLTSDMTQSRIITLSSTGIASIQ